MSQPESTRRNGPDRARRAESRRMVRAGLTALVVPAVGPVDKVRLPADDAAGNRLAILQQLVGGRIEAIPVPPFVDGTGRSTAYVNEEGKHRTDCPPNLRATDFFVPGVGLFAGDYIAGTCVFVGFDRATGRHTELPRSVVARIRLIEREAA